MTEADERFAHRAIRRKSLFFGLIVRCAVPFWRQPGFPVASRAVIVLLILLSARQSLRQYKYAPVLAGLKAARPR